MRSESCMQQKHSHFKGMHADIFACNKVQSELHSLFNSVTKHYKQNRLFNFYEAMIGWLQ